MIISVIIKTINFDNNNTNIDSIGSICIHSENHNNSNVMDYATNRMVTEHSEVICIHLFENSNTNTDSINIK